MRIVRDEDGQILVVVLLCMGVMLGFLAIAIDVGQLLYTRRQLQTEADAAALAGALEISQCGTTSNCAAMQTAATAAFTENNLPTPALLTQCSGTAGSGLTLELNNGPCALGSTDPNKGNTKYVEAVVSKKANTFFAGLLGVNSVMLTARSEAGMGPPNFCVFVSANNTGAGAGDAVQFNSGAHMTTSCGLVDDSGSSPDLFADSGSHVSVPVLDVHGTYSSNNGAHFDNASPTNNSQIVADPLSWVPQPSVGGCTSVSPVSGKNQTLSQGTYCGININSGGSLTLNPGNYVFTGSVNVDSGASLSGTGVFLYFSSGTLTPNSGSTVTLYAPTTGTYAGILLYQAPTDTAEMDLDSGSKSVWQGAIYLPDATLTINSGGNAAAYTILDVESLIIDSGAKFTLSNDYSSLPGGAPISGTNAYLME